MYRIVTTSEIESNRNAFSFCTIPAYANFALVSERGEVMRWYKASETAEKTRALLSARPGIKVCC